MYKPKFKIGQIVSAHITSYGVTCIVISEIEGIYIIIDCDSGNDIERGIRYKIKGEPCGISESRLTLYTGKV